MMNDSIEEKMIERLRELKKLCEDPDTMKKMERIGVLDDLKRLLKGIAAYEKSRECGFHYPKEESK